MTELTLLRNTRDDTREPSRAAVASGRRALLERAAAEHPTIPTAGASRRRSGLPRLTWAAAGVAAALTTVLVVGTINLGAQSAYASDVLRSAATQTSQGVALVPGPGEFLRSRTHARWQGCTSPDDDPQNMVCAPNDQILDVYMPADAGAAWTLYRDWGELRGVFGEASIETTHAVDGRFYGTPWVGVDFAEIPTDGAAAYEWVGAQYIGGSASRDEDNFVRIADILRSGLVPAPQRAALLDALSRVPGVGATDSVANLDGVIGVAIGRNELLRAGQRAEIIIDPDSGLVIGERTLTGAAVFGWGPNEEIELTAIETTVVDTAP